ncbi:hypothetical protein Pla100_28270 [Neorhodopirellula pilleata]|uniref:Uncharacterized protein n=1 Tax=Neorhodopirellula pilleata TaxID=2714738 RepID=A0A5C6AAC5_9BACT|nr:hypothetical protein Pla100_28270 [Neorhodopirellula pilleata]
MVTPMGEPHYGMVGKDGKSGNRDSHGSFDTQGKKTGSGWSDCSEFTECWWPDVPITPLEAIPTQASNDSGNWDENSTSLELEPLRPGPMA